MTIVKTIEGNTAKFTLNGKLNNTSAPELEKEIEALDDSVTELIFDFESLSYVSSAGLRVIINVQKSANETGKRMTLTNVNEDIMEIFDMTGFINFLTIA